MNFARIVLSTCLIVSASSTVLASSLSSVDLTSGEWLIFAVDDAGNTWNNSKLIFENQTESGENLALAGYFYWEGSNGSYGRENFTGTLSADRALTLTGYEIVLPYNNLVVGNYYAELVDSNDKLINGSWTGLPGILGVPSDDWSAELSDVPLPASVWLFGSALIGLAIKKSKNLA